MEIFLIVAIVLFILFFSDFGLLMGTRRKGKADREKEDEKYSFKKFKKK